jgi:SAM-dependent methyltransferase
MDKRTELLEQIYGAGGEADRLIRSRHGQLEFLTTTAYIDLYAPRPCRVLELGAGTGAYTAAMAQKGHRVTAVELLDKNFELLQANTAQYPNVEAVQGDALDLGRWADGCFDLTLSMGPLYHLYDRGDVDRAIDEAIRVTRTGGILMFAFLSVHAILYDNYLQAEPYTFRAGWEENFDKDMRVRHFPEQVFTGYDVAQFEALFEDKPVAHLRTVATDGILELAEGRSDFAMTDEDFRLFSAYHLLHCEKRELLGSSAHLLYICRKENE